MDVSNAISGGEFQNVVMAAHAHVTLASGGGPVGLPDLPELPPVPQGFTGREAELAELLALLDPEAVSAEPVLVASVAGLGGVGKTTLALATAHAALDRARFAHALFVDLRGYDDSPVAPGQVLDTLLRALGIPPAELPPDDGGRAALLRSRLRTAGGLGTLIVADNASTADQVRHLRPGPGPHRLLVTSRHTLSALDATLVDLDVLTPDGAVDLIARRLRTARRRPERITDDSTDALRLAGLCGHLPLALALVATELVQDPHLALTELADELSEEGGRLERIDGLSDGQRPVRLALDRSRRRLDPAQTELLDLLALAPGPDISTAAAAALTANSPREARRRLAGLAATGLLRQSPEGGRWSMHDLVREYAAGHARAAGDRYAPHLRALLAHYADEFERAHLGPDADGYPGAEDVGWVSDECSNLIEAAQLAEATGEWATAFRIGKLLASYGPLYGDQERLETTTLMLRVARRLDDPDREGEAWHDRGLALRALNRRVEAAEALRSALRLWSGHPAFCVVAWFNLGQTLSELGEFPTYGGRVEPDGGVDEPPGETWGIPEPMWRFAEAVRVHEEWRAADSRGGDEPEPAAGPQRTGEETGSA
ncbi:regulator [Kitasatospora sp. NPDC090091]|uniref:regulator n=1 Tax=Kitasatospora sp. NPDC090091 TaxID=3364081 RepID=UPI0038064B06